ncbi:SDR family NAD(P)-dependent oxidoreductase [Amycolatopsis benzoatilytica]|uniref:SDR family NAD(P)-dependent oxidoreductase n=1 Tax=Amycolatopsis benzoatilytica TaxID=346045 RepID=UPI001B7FDDE0|nr:glucose 1-dehydrogenase [Amycolatopsis benzoatilytica]
MSLEGLFSLEGKTALVTGASRGIGRAVALGLARAGANVAVLARTTEALEEVAAEIRSVGRESMVLTCDVTDRSQVDLAVSDAVAGLGHLDISVHNAGGFAHLGPLLDLREEDWSGIIQANLYSAIYFCRAVGAHMVSRGTGAVVNVASIAGTAGFPMASPYSAAKAGTIALTRSLGAEWAASGVRANALVPGWVSTDLTASFVKDPAAADGLLHAVPVRRWGKPEDLVGAAIFLASDASRLVTGSSLVVDGGLTCYTGGPTTLDLLSKGRVAV